MHSLAIVNTTIFRRRSSAGSYNPTSASGPHYKCHRVRGARFRKPPFKVETQFGELEISIKRPRSLCLPVDKNGEGIANSVLSVMCYQVRTVPQEPRHVFTNGQFEDDEYDVFGVRDLCVPSFKDPGTCGDGSFNAPGEECEVGDNDAVCPVGCDPQTCTCLPPPVCGDGVRQDGEQCDGAADSACPQVCLPDCTCPSYGNGVVEAPEQCDPPGGMCLPGEECIGCLCEDLE